MAQTDAIEAAYRDADVVVAEQTPFDAEQRFEGTVVIESNVVRPILVKRTWDVDDSGTVHESTHYYAANEPTQSAHVVDSINVEWEPANPDNLEDELMSNLTMDAQAEVEAVMHDASERTLERKLGYGNQ